jgi:predicted nucleic acid-binding protein
MPDSSRIVVNTGPILALLACDRLWVLRKLYDQVWAPHEVCEEITAGGQESFGYAAFLGADWLRRSESAVAPGGLLARLLDAGEASVVQLALDMGIPLVCIDESAGRRVARMSGLTVTGSLGILIRAIRERHTADLAGCIAAMRSRGVWLSDRVAAEALALAGE